MRNLKLFLDLIRFKQPIGFMLLFWPCSWGLAYAYISNQNTNLFLNYLILFFLGSVLMRSAGCIVNDIVDEKIDKQVSRTKERPIASGSLSKKLAWISKSTLSGTTRLTDFGTQAPKDVTIGTDNWTTVMNLRGVSESDDVWRPAVTTADANAEAVTYVDAVTTYDYGNATFRFGINNLTDENPPYFHSNFNGNTEPGVYDVIGRRAFVSVVISY